MTTGKRFNKGKLRWRNFPRFLVRPLIRVGQFGESKYTTFNFLKGLPTLDTLDSLERHLDKFLDPNQPDVDEESGCHHLAHVAWNALVALYMLETRPDLDDRYKGQGEDSKTTDSYVTISKHSVTTRLPDGTTIVEERKNESN